MLTAIRNWVLRTMMKDQTGVMRTLPRKDIFDFNVQMTAERLMRGGVDPNSLKNANQVENALKMIDDRPKVQKGITSTKSAKIMDMEGKEIDPRSKIMGGKQSETDAEIKARLDKANKEGIQRIRIKKAKEYKLNLFKNLDDNKKLNDDEYEEFLEQIGGEDRLEAYDFDGTAGSAKRILKDDVEYEEYMFDQYTKGNLDPKQPKSNKPITSMDKQISEEFQRGMKEGKFNNVRLKDGRRIKSEDDFREYIDELNEDNNFDFAQGGIARLGFKDGMTRRTFLKILGGAMAIPIVGKFLKPFKTAKGVTKVPIIKTDNVPGKPEWFDQLVNKVIIEGDDVTKKFATGERQSIHQKTLNDGSVVRVTEDVDQGAVRVEYDSKTNPYEETTQLEYKKPLPDEGAPSPTAEFSAAETGPIARSDSPRLDYEKDIEEFATGNVDELVTDFSKLKEYATGQKPTMKEIVEAKKKKDQAKKLTEGDFDAEFELMEKRQGQPFYNPPEPDDFASGGIARMLGE